MNEKQKAVLEYIQRGFVIHPLTAPDSKGASPGKRPVLKGWSQRTIDSEVKLKWFENRNNVGLVCGKPSGVTIIDFDSEENLIHLLDGLCVNTLQSRRTQGRRHLYFQYCPELRNCKMRKLQIEVLNDGANVVMPPSTHASGDEYEWINPGTKPEKIPEEFIVRLQNLAGDHPITREV